MFFELHEENRIGYKELSDADLGRSENSRQTHIGLFDDVLTFLPNSSVIKDAMVIYNNKAIKLTLHFDRIQNPDGSYRSPKIRSGSRNEESVLSFIRRTAKTALCNGTWYLFWFGLKSKQPVFLVFEKDSKVYSDLREMGIDFRSGVKGRLHPRDSAFFGLLDYLEHMVNVRGIEYAEELELMAQTGKKKGQYIRKYDFSKAQARAAEIGREGERLIDLFFQEQKQKGEILNYFWMNKDGESGQSYDFAVEKLDGKIVYLDVKTTDFRFEQKMLFSSQEIEFASEYKEDYYVYRVYCDDSGARFLKICNDIDGLFCNIDSMTSEYKTVVGAFAHVQTVKFAISPTHSSFDISEPIAL